MDFENELETLLRSRFTLICVVSMEEERVLKAIENVCTRGNRPLALWDHADGYQPLGRGGEPLKAKDPLSVLEEIGKLASDGVFVLRDFHQCWDKQPRIVRKLRNLAQQFRYTRKTIIVLLPNAEVPQELKDDAVLLDYAPPGVAELEGILNQLLATPGARSTLNEDGRGRLLRSALGLSSNQAQRVFAKAIVTGGLLEESDVDLVMSEKKQIIRESGALEFYEARETPADVGGLGVLKEWLRLRERALGAEARAYGLPEPKGLALIGIPGTGKSLTAKMIAGLWRLPLVRMDVGALFGSLVGQSEANTRRALSLVETVAPCILWIDEMEKALSTGDGDAGTSMRVFGSLLSWMQDKKKPVFVVATANNIARMPPELLRRGRFDEIFFLDLPTADERREILAVHLRKRRRAPEGFDLGKLAAASEGYVGAEIEQAIIDAMYVAFNDPKQPAREITTADVLDALHRQVPMSQSHREVIAGLRQWLKDGRAQSASFADATQARRECVQLEVTPPGESSRGG
jgi:AAA+ superfamily predicted ATPase